MKNYMSYNIMPDGTVKHENPFFDYEVWSVPGRANKPRSYGTKPTIQRVTPEHPERVCSFCETRYLETPPERARVVKQSGDWTIFRRLDPREYFNTTAEFRRVGNLFELVTMDYWRKNYNYIVDNTIAAWKDTFTSSAEGREYLRKIVSYKLEAMGRPDQYINGLSDDTIFSLADGFFGGGHEVVIARPHYRHDAEYENDLVASGDLTGEQHFWYFKMTIDGMKEIVDHNRFVRYVCAFQNWLQPAGASFDHLHKQLVGLDDWGALIGRKIELRRNNENVFNEFGVNYALDHNLVFLENDFGVAYAGIGHRYPTVEIHSKSENARPYEHTDEEIYGMSELVHAIHAATGSKVSANEEWYYTPVDSVETIPWHIYIIWRINVPAGFEGGTNIYINPLTPVELRDRLVPKLFELRDEGRISNVKIAEECDVQLNPLRYFIK